MRGSDSAPAPLVLHGHPVSNYFNAARAALIEKGADFTVVPTRAAQEDAFLAQSAMGKIPYLRTPHGCIAETVAILEYVEDTVPGVSLYPAGAFERARARQVINIVQVYVEASLRSLYPGVFMGGANAPEAIAAVRPVVDRAMRALSHLVTPAPFLMGGQLTHADLFTFHHFDLGERVMQFTYGTSLIDAVPGLRDWHATLAARPSIRTVLADFHPAFAAYLRDKGAAWHEPEPKEPSYA
ncbi:glutathione S-transferase family protein [Sphingobium terrigena]|nr:glutathione S-transferase family protein [Sphingobium terrigena]